MKLNKLNQEKVNSIHEMFLGSTVKDEEEEEKQEQEEYELKMLSLRLASFFCMPESAEVPIDHPNLRRGPITMV